MCDRGRSGIWSLLPDDDEQLWRRDRRSVRIFSAGVRACDGACGGSRGCCGKKRDHRIRNKPDASAARMRKAGNRKKTTKRK